MSPSKKSRHWWAYLIVACGAVGCSGSTSDLAEVERAARPRMEHFEAFERWARRTLSAGGQQLSHEALEETLFAPMRRDETALAIWVERLGPLGRVYRLGRRCDRAPAEENFHLLRSLDIDWARGHCGELPVLFLRRTRPYNQGDMRITAAYGPGAGQP